MGVTFTSIKHAISSYALAHFQRISTSSRTQLGREKAFALRKKATLANILVIHSSSHIVKHLPMWEMVVGNFRSLVKPYFSMYNMYIIGANLSWDYCLKVFYVRNSFTQSLLLVSKVTRTKSRSENDPLLHFRIFSSATKKPSVSTGNALQQVLPSHHITAHLVLISMNFIPLAEKIRVQVRKESTPMGTWNYCSSFDKSLSTGVTLDRQTTLSGSEWVIL